MLVRYQAALRPDTKRELVYHQALVVSSKRMEKMSGLEKKMQRLGGRRPSSHLRALPPPLFPGACIGVVAPAGAPDISALEAGLEEVRRRGYDVKVADQVYLRDDLGFAGPDILRAETLMDFFEDPSVDGLWMARGGYGCTRLFSHLEARRIAPFPKRLMGFSDATALLSFLWGDCGMAGFHGPVLTQLGRLPEPDRAAAFGAFGWDGKGSLAMPFAGMLREGQARGWLCGGNLTMLSHLLGTPWCPDFSGSLLFLEDVNEAGYRIDRMLCHLSMAGVMDEIAGLILGSFTGCGNTDTLYARILAHVPPGLPVAWGLPLGHGETHQPLLWGAEGFLDAEAGLLRWEWNHACP